MTDQTPSPQSVVVPVEPTEEMWTAARKVWHDHERPYTFDCTKATFRAMLAAAPAPSSLAGGEVSVPSSVIAACKGEQEHFEAWAKAKRYEMSEHPLHYIFNDPKTDAARMGWNAALAYVRDAALSPEAPAREGELLSNPQRFDDEIVWLREAARYFAARDTKGEDRAHWANVYNSENAGKLADRLTELSSNPCQLEAPAEGAGEIEAARARMFGGMVEVSNYGGLDNPQDTFMADLRTLLRARSSAPEAPSADKLRMAVEALDVAKSQAERGADKAGCDGWRAQEMCRQIAPLIDQALAALKAEGA